MADEYDPLAPRQDAFMRTLGEAVNEFRAMDVRAVFTTVCLLTILFSGYYIPLYGLDLEMVSQMKLSSGAIDRVSMLTLSVAPWVSVVILVETIGLFIAPLRASIGFRDGHCNPFHWFVILLTMVLTAVQAYGINTAYQATGLVSVVSLLSSIVIIGSIVAGTIVTVLIAAFINAWGVGYGFWLVFGFTLPFAIPDSLHTRFELAREGQIPFFPGWAIEVGILLAVMLVTVLMTRSLINKEITTPARLRVSTDDRWAACSLCPRFHLLYN
ncbi:MAG: hypothetical protein U5K75_00400 [Ahrensia sp.]|nr:hypothetical protein [Ahrensia sp.]